MLRRARLLPYELHRTGLVIWSMLSRRLPPTIVVPFETTIPLARLFTFCAVDRDYSRARAWL